MTTIAIVVDNRAGDGLAVEHGLSLWIDSGDRKILFDTGQGGALDDNAHLLGINLAETGILVLSHGHYDHTGGVAGILRQAHQVHLYCHAGVVQPRYALQDGLARPIQMPGESRAAVNAMYGERLHWIYNPVMLSDRVGLTGPIPRETDYEDRGGPFYCDPAGKRIDLIEDDCALWIRTDRGLVVCVGCAHAGVINTLRYVCRLAGESRVRAVIGGLHLVNADSRRLDRTVDDLRSIDPEMIVPCHCTGDAAAAILREGLGERVIPGAAGMVLQF